MSAVADRLTRMGLPWKPTRELTRDLRGGWTMRVRGRGHLGRIEPRNNGRTTVYVPIAPDGAELEHCTSLSAAAAALWTRPAGAGGHAVAR